MRFISMHLNKLTALVVLCGGFWHGTFNHYQRMLRLDTAARNLHADAHGGIELFAEEVDKRIHLHLTIPLTDAERNAFNHDVLGLQRAMKQTKERCSYPYPKLQQYTGGAGFCLWWFYFLFRFDIPSDDAPIYHLTTDYQTDSRNWNGGNFRLRLNNNHELSRRLRADNGNRDLIEVDQNTYLRFVLTKGEIKSILLNQATPEVNTKFKERASHRKDGKGSPSVFDNLISWAQQYQSHLEGIRSAEQQRQREAQLAEEQRRINEAHARLLAEQARLVEVQRQMNAQMEQTNISVGKVENRLDKVETSLTKTEGTVKSLREEVDKLWKRITEISGNIKEAVHCEKRATQASSSRPLPQPRRD